MQVAIDIETTGLNPTLNHILEIGFVWESQNPDFDYRAIRVVCCKENFLGNVQALTINAALIQEIANKAVSLSFMGKKYHTGPWLNQGRIEAKLYYLSDWEYLGDCLIDAKAPFYGDKITPIGKNFSGFDRPFIERYCPDILKFRHRSIDVGNLWMLPEDETPPDLMECIRRAGLSTDNAALHTAVWDAMMCFDLYRAWKEVWHESNRRVT